MTRFRVAFKAKRDVDLAVAYYAQAADLDVALRFLLAVEEGYQEIAEHPLAGSLVRTIHPRLNALRRWPVPGFESHWIYYLSDSVCLEVVRVLHAARDLEKILGHRSKPGGA